MREGEILVARGWRSLAVEKLVTTGIVEGRARRESPSPSGPIGGNGQFNAECLYPVELQP